jgi:hypothetical protein
MMHSAVRAISFRVGTRELSVDRLQLGFDDGEVTPRLVGLAERQAGFRCIGYATMLAPNGERVVKNRPIPLDRVFRNVMVP